jgi:hypothetical protein
MLPRQSQKQVQRGASSAAPVMPLAPINRKILVLRCGSASLGCFVGARCNFVDMSALSLTTATSERTLYDEVQRRSRHDHAKARPRPWIAGLRPDSKRA